MKNLGKLKPAAFNTRLAAYSATAGAVLAATQAQASIQNITSFNYNSTTTTTPPVFTGSVVSGSISFDAGPLNASFGGFNSGFFAQIRVGGNILINTHSVSPKLAPGQAIASAGSFKFTGAIQLAFGNRFGSHAGAFFPPSNGAVTGYIGLKAHKSSHTYYGWMNVKVSGDSNGLPAEATLVSVAGNPGVYGAYGLASDAITAGELASPTPEPGTLAIGGLGLLALGARGVRELRRRRETAAKN